MNQRIANLKEYIRAQQHHQFRQDKDLELATEFQRLNVSPVKRGAKRLVKVLEAERPVLLPFERIVFTRTIKTFRIFIQLMSGRIYGEPSMFMVMDE